MIVQERTQNTARLVTLEQILENILPNHFNPVPARETVRTWLDKAGIARFKSNPVARRGGGRVWYSAAGVEKFIKGRTIEQQRELDPREFWIAEIGEAGGRFVFESESAAQKYSEQWREFYEIPITTIHVREVLQS